MKPYHANNLTEALIVAGEEARFARIRGEDVLLVEHREELEGKYAGDYLVIDTDAGEISIFSWTDAAFGSG